MTTLPTRKALLMENQRLKAQLEALKKERAPISIDPAKGRITVQNYATENFVIDRLVAHSDGISDMAGGVAQVEQWIRPGQRPQVPDLNNGLRQKISVDELKMTVPYSAINSLLPRIAGPQMRKAGVTEIVVSKGEKANQLSIKGKAKKVFQVEFDAVGELTVTKNGQPRFRLGQTHVGSIPMPNFVAGIATQIFAGSSMRQFGIEQQGTEFTVDVSKMLPGNIKSSLTTIRIDEEGFVIEGGRPDAKGPNQVAS